MKRNDDEQLKCTTCQYKLLQQIHVKGHMQHLGHNQSVLSHSKYAQPHPINQNQKNKIINQFLTDILVYNVVIPF